MWTLLVVSNLAEEDLIQCRLSQFVTDFYNLLIYFLHFIFISKTNVLKRIIFQRHRTEHIYLFSGWQLLVVYKTRGHIHKDAHRKTIMAIKLVNTSNSVVPLFSLLQIGLRYLRRIQSFLLSDLQRTYHMHPVPGITTFQITIFITMRVRAV